MSDLLLAIDQGTTGSTALVLTKSGEVKGRANVEFPQHFPQPGWVEHEPEEIWSSVLTAVERAIAMAKIDSKQIAAIGITNQRETTVVWDRATGKPIHRAIVWQDRRTTVTCAALKDAGHEARVREKTGLVLDPYFSGTKIAWLLDAVPGARARAEKGELAFGTIETFLVHRLTGGAAHVTDASNASRTLLLDLKTQAWDDELLSLLRVPRQVLPRVVGCAEIVGTTKGVAGLADGIPIAGMAGDQQSALFGQSCFSRGDVKCTYGTGAFVLMNVGEVATPSKHGLVTTIAWKLRSDSAATFALEGSAFIAGAAVQWLRDGLGIIESAAEIEALARSVNDSAGVVFVPALTGLGAPHWDPSARGVISGLTRGATKAHLARATLEGIAHEVADLTDAMQSDASGSLGGARLRVRVDGGASANRLLLDLQALLSDARVERPADIETTSRGAAMLAALGVGLARDLEALRGWSVPDVAIEPSESTAALGGVAAGEARASWRRAIARARSN